jgi:hypothetical protein
VLQGALNSGSSLTAWKIPSPPQGIASTGDCLLRRVGRGFHLSVDVWQGCVRSFQGICCDRRYTHVHAVALSQIFLRILNQGFE